MKQIIPQTELKTNCGFLATDGIRPLKGINKDAE